MSVVTIDSGARPLNPSIVGGAGTAIQIFPALVFPNAGLNSVAVSTPGPLSLPVPANGQYEMVRFSVIASGKMFIHGTSPTQLFSMYNGTSMTAASDTLVLTMSALSGLTTNKWYPWSWKSEFQGDSSSGILQAINSTLWVNNATAGTITLTGIASGLNMIANGPVGLVPSGYSTTNAFNLIISVKSGVSDALNSYQCAQLVLEC